MEWAKDELRRIAETDDLHIAALRDRCPSGSAWNRAQDREAPDAAPLDQARLPSQNEKAGRNRSLCPALRVARSDKPGLTTTALRHHA